MSGHRIMLPDDFDPRRNPDPRTLFAMLGNGKTLGKRAPLLISNVKDATALSPTNLLEVNGPDDAAMPMVLTIAPPKFIRETSILGFPNIDVQGVNGFQAFSTLSAAFPNSDLTALIEWGTGGVSQSAEVDIINGAVVNLHASFVRVRVKATQINGGAGTGGVYEVGAFLSPGEGKSYHPNTLTKNFAAGLAIGANTGAVVIPSFARSMNMVCQIGSVQCRYWRDFNRTVLVSAYTIFGTGGVNTKSPIPNGAAVVDFQNPGAAASIGGLSMIFELMI